MKLTEALDLLQEKKSDEKSTETVGKSRKGRVKTYKNQKDALSKSYMGQIWSTIAAGRLYVTTKGKWGKKSGRGKVAKGFTKGSATPSASWPSIKKHSARTMLRYGSGSDKLAAKYGSRTIRRKRGIGGKDGRLDKGA